MVKSLEVPNISGTRVLYFALVIALVGAAGVVGTEDPTITRTLSPPDAGYEDVSEIYFFSNMTAEEQDVVRQFQSGENVTVTNPQDGHFALASNDETVAVIENQSVTRMYVESPDEYWPFGIFGLVVAMLVSCGALLSRDNVSGGLFECGLALASIAFTLWMVVL